jgi:hypothetical protein
MAELTLFFERRLDVAPEISFNKNICFLGPGMHPPKTRPQTDIEKLSINHMLDLVIEYR